MAKSLFMEHTGVSATRSIGAIQHMLTEPGAVSISQRMKERRIAGISCTLASNQHLLAFELPARVEPVFQSLLLQRHREPSESDKALLHKRAEDIAWRQLAKWLEAQLAIVGMGMAQAQEVFMPYCLGPDGRTMYEHWKGRLLEAPREEKP